MNVYSLENGKIVRLMTGRIGIGIGIFHFEQVNICVYETLT